MGTGQAGLLNQGDIGPLQLSPCKYGVRSTYLIRILAPWGRTGHVILLLAVHNVTLLSPLPIWDGSKKSSTTHQLIVCGRWESVAMHWELWRSHQAKAKVGAPYMLRTYFKGRREGCCTSAKDVSILPGNPLPKSDFEMAIGMYKHPVPLPCLLSSGRFQCHALQSSVR